MSLTTLLFALAPAVIPWARQVNEFEAENQRLKEELAEMKEQLLDLAVRMERVRSERNEWRTRYELNSIPSRQLTPQEMYAQTQNAMMMYAQAQNVMQAQQNMQAAQHNAYQAGLQGLGQIGQLDEMLEVFCNCTPSRAHGLLGVIPGG
jgi:predicted RNase H-like nuclease (RuvC/YqgF family)